MCYWKAQEMFHNAWKYPIAKKRASRKEKIIVEYKLLLMLNGIIDSYVNPSCFIIPTTS
jgi:hypothetical protein